MNANGSVGTELMVFMTLLLARYSDCCHHPLGSKSSLVHCHHHYHYSTQCKWPVDDQICPNKAPQKCAVFWVRHSPEAHSSWWFWNEWHKSDRHVQLLVDSLSSSPSITFIWQSSQPRWNLSWNEKKNQMQLILLFFPAGHQHTPPAFKHQKSIDLEVKSESAPNKLSSSWIVS